MSAPIEKLPKIIKVLKDMGAKKIVLFGSAADKPETAKDIDLAVDGIPLSRILEADASVNALIKYPVDLVSKEENPAFFEVVSRYGKVIYEQE